MPAIANTEMAAAWDGPDGDDWTDNAERYESSGARIWRRFEETVEIGERDRVLDIGCGTGRSTRAAARRASSGSALGIDLSSRMLERARRESEKEGLANVEFVHGDAQVHAFDPGAADLAISSFGAMFFADPVAAFGNVGRGLRAGGGIALLAWQPLEANEWLGTIWDSLAAGRTLPAPPAGAPGPFGLAEPDRVRDVLGRAGFEDVTLTAITEPVWLGTDAEDAWGFVAGLGVVRGLTANLDAEAKQRALGVLREAMAAHETPDGVLFGAAAWLVRARTP